jgi:hypothetical protein
VTKHTPCHGTHTEVKEEIKTDLSRPIRISCLGSSYLHKHSLKISLQATSVFLRQKRFPAAVSEVVSSNELHLVRIDFVMHMLDANFARSHVTAAET